MAASVDMTWVLDDLTGRMPEIEKVVLLSRDGLAVSSCDARDRSSCRDVLLALIAHLRRLQEGAYGQRATLWSLRASG
jgi:predicted regulator of Ras-like GTPase activity (Roadblock/LC7/MglB family)